MSVRLTVRGVGIKSERKTDVKSNTRKEPRVLLPSPWIEDDRRGTRLEAFGNTGETYRRVRNCLGGPDRHAITEPWDESGDTSRDAENNSDNTGLERIRVRWSLVGEVIGGSLVINEWGLDCGINFSSYESSPTLPALIIQNVGFVRYLTWIRREPIGSSIGANSQTLISCPERPRVNVSISEEGSCQHVDTHTLRV